MRIIFIFLILLCQVIASAQTYSTSSQGKNYTGSKAYVAPVVTKTYTTPSQPAPRNTYNSSSVYKPSSGYSGNYNLRNDNRSNYTESNRSTSTSSNREENTVKQTITPKAVRTEKYDYKSTYTNGVAIATLNNKEGLIDTKENEITPIMYDIIYYFSEGLYGAKLNGKAGFIDPAGKTVIPFRYDNVSGFYSGVATVTLNDKQTVINRSGIELFPFKYNFVYYTGTGLSEVMLDKKIGYIDQKGTEIIPVKYDSVLYLVGDAKKLFLNGDHYYFDKKGAKMKVYDWVSDYDQHGIASVSLNDKFGRINSKNITIIPVIYENLNFTVNGMTGMKINGQWGFLNALNKEVITPRFDSILVNFDKKGQAIVLKDGKMFSIDKTGKKIKDVAELPKEKPEFDPWKVSKFAKDFDAVGDFKDGLSTVNKNNKWGYINTEGKVVIPIIYYSAFNFNEGLADVINDYKKHGYIDIKGDVVIPFEYDDASQFFEGKARVCKNGKCGFINFKGEVIVPLEYDKVAYVFSEGLAEVERNYLSGFINAGGTVVIPIKYVGAEDFSNGLAAVRLRVNNEAKWGFINANDEMVIAPQFDYSAKFDKQGKAKVSLNGKNITINKAGKKLQ